MLVMSGIRAGRIPCIRTWRASCALASADSGAVAHALGQNRPGVLPRGMTLDDVLARPERHTVVAGPTVDRTKLWRDLAVELKALPPAPDTIPQASFYETLGFAP